MSTRVMSNYLGEKLFIGCPHLCIETKNFLMVAVRSYQLNNEHLGKEVIKR
jgi:hypothetical protein